MADKTLSGKVAIVTGAASPIGMGRAMALALVGPGARVGLADIDARGLVDAVGAASEIGGVGCALALDADISDSTQADAIVQRAIGELGGLQVLVNNAGIQLRRPPRPEDPRVHFSAAFWETDARQWDSVVAINLSGQFYMARAAIGHMLDQRWGRIIGAPPACPRWWAGARPRMDRPRPGTRR